MLGRNHKIQGQQADLFSLRRLSAFIMISLTIISAFINDESHYKIYKVSNLKD